MALRRDFAIILCQFNDIAAPNLPLSFFSQTFSPGFGGLYDYWRDVSYTQIDSGLSAVFGWYTMQYSFFIDSGKSRGTWTAEARRLAANAGVDLSKFYGVIAAVNAGGSHNSQGYGVDEGQIGLDVAVDVPGVWGQNNWRWCKKCQALNYGAVPNSGPCAAGGVHDDSTGANYSVAMNQPGFSGQANWRWCKKCQEMNFGGGVGPCAAGGTHDNSASGNYTLSSGQVAFPGQDQWTWCNKCQCLAYSGGAPGVCPAGGNHNAASNDYVLVNNLELTSFCDTFLGHETGHTLGLGHSWLAHPEKEYGNPYDIMSAMAVDSFNDSPYPPAGPGVNAPNLDFLGLLPAEFTWTPPAATAGSETIQLVAINDPTFGHLAAKVIKADSTYYVEYRRPTGWDHAFAQQAVFINESRTWVWCNKCQELTLASANPPGPCAAGGAHDSTGSGFYTLFHDTPANLSGQNSWLWCNKCQALTYAGGSPGACPAGGTHDQTGSNNYTLVHDATYGQTNWRWCSKCQALNFAGGPALGPCAAGGTHNIASDNYGLNVSSQQHSFLLGDAAGQVQWQPGKVFVEKSRALGIVIHSFDSGATPTATVSIANLQNNWRWCTKCQGLAYAGGAIPGPCPAGGSHDHTGSGDYSLLHDLPGAAGQDNWRWCSKCQGLAYAGISQGVCPAGGTHNIASYDYVLLHDTSMADAQSNWRWCNKCQGLAYAGNSQGVCPAGGTHNIASDNYNLIDV
jgi:hypothetical protein